MCWVLYRDASGSEGLGLQSHTSQTTLGVVLSLAEPHLPHQKHGEDKGFLAGRSVMEETGHRIMFTQQEVLNTCWLPFHSPTNLTNEQWHVWLWLLEEVISNLSSALGLYIYRPVR